jgi:cation diffusion facilitator CzcD-associated flavoprotein CzcO/acetyl esterase/lipase
MASGGQSGDSSVIPEYDAVVVGAGMAGLYQLYRLRKDGFATIVLEAADDVGGTWYYNRYPGARCDIESVDYSYSFDPELETQWTWSERYATQPEILRYFQHVAKNHDLKKDIRFSTRVQAAAWDEDASMWRIRTSAGDEITARFFIMATGCLSVPKAPDIKGVERFRGDVYFTSSWPHDDIDFSGQRVAVIGTGSSGIQSIPLIAQQAAQLTVFQRTANFSIPAHNGPLRSEKLAAIEGRFAEYRKEARWSRAGVPRPVVQVRALDVSEGERRAAYERMWDAGDLLGISGAFADILASPEANETLCEFIRRKVRSIVEDPKTAEALCPHDHPVGTKRPCLDTNYYATFNLPHVRLVDLKKSPITAITETGIDTTAESFEFDAIVYATGFDAVTGAIVAVDITGRDGATLKQRWTDGPRTYLGLTTVGFPNLFMITGPESPSVLSNMAVSIEQHVDWIGDTMHDLRERGFETIEPTATAEAGWKQHCIDCASLTLFPKANSWYMGANVPGKPRVLFPYIGGVDVYRRTCDEVRERGYLGFKLDGPNRSQCNDGVIRRLMPDIAMVLEMIASLGLPPIESLSPVEARAFAEASSAARPSGPKVGEIVDGAYPGAAGELNYRLYRPDTPGPHPVVVYFHGGGWVLGSHTSDDPLCRDLCVRSGCMIVSCDYRHGPEARFPAAPDDAFAALKWVSQNAESLGGISGSVVVAGWSAGANLAAVVAQMARDMDGPPISGQVLLTPVADCDFSRESYVQNADGYLLTAALMRWFWDHYLNESERSNPKASPLRGDLKRLPRAFIVTCEFDPLRDEGAAYAAALAAAGNDVVHFPSRGHTHTSVTMVDVVMTGAPIRDALAQALHKFSSAALGDEAKGKSRSDRKVGVVPA